MNREGKILQILITAGGTSEPIDPVRAITNTSTGRLGSLIAARFAADTGVEKIHYICSRTAPAPETDKAVVTRVFDVADLEAAVRDTLANNKIDAVIHSMAVSDYRVKSVTTAALLSESIAEGIAALSDSEDAAADIERAILAAQGLDRTEKLSSAEENLIVAFERTPKIIALIRKLAPEALLVGFKLLDDVPVNALLDTAYSLLEKNACAFVLANDSREIGDERHVGHLLDRARRVRTFETKAQIADGIAAAVLAALREG
jgi:phosphopantothenate-cysteine ligase